MDADELRITARMAKLALKPEEMEKLRIAVEQMLAHFSHMNEFDVEGLAPTTHALVGQNRTRTDQEASDISPEVLLQNAAQREERLIMIPNVL